MTIDVGRAFGVTESDSLRVLLLRWLLAPLLTLLLVATLISFYSVRVATTRAFDRALQDPIQAIVQRIVFVRGHPVLLMSQDSLRSLFTHVYDKAYFQLADDAGHVFAGNLNISIPSSLQGTASLAGRSSRLSALPSARNSQLVFYNARYAGHDVRVGAMRLVLVDADGVLHPLVVQIAETLIRRDRNLYELLALTLMPALVIALAAVALVSQGIRRGLEPLEVLRREISSRSHTDLRPVPEQHAPLEARPVVMALNTLLGNLSAVIEGQHRFLANAAHQLRTPLAGLQTQVELLLREPLPADTANVLRTLLDATRRVTHLANQLLALARAEPGAQYLLQLQQLDLAEVVEGMMAGWLPVAQEKNIDIGFELQSVCCMADRLLLTELIGNLVDNAMRYTPRGGVVTVRCYQTEYSVIEVEDNGMGIPVGQRQNVLERFYRVEGSPGNGCGLGLSIVTEIVRQHQARLEILDTDSGVGVRMRVSFLPCMA